MKIFLLLIFLIFCGCRNDVYEQMQIKNRFEKCEDERILLEKRNFEIFRNKNDLENFLNAFLFDSEFHKFSLNDSLVTFYGNDNVFIYSVSKEQIWSSRCGVLEKISEKQADEINRMLNAYIEKLEGLNLKGETWSTLAIWKSKMPRKLKAYDVGYENLSQRVVIEKYFADSIFVHGCKRHVLTY